MKELNKTFYVSKRFYIYTHVFSLATLDDLETVPLRSQKNHAPMPVSPYFR